MPITLHPELKARLRARAAAAELEALALEGLNSGESVQADEQYRSQKRQQLIDRHQKPGSR